MCTILASNLLQVVPSGAGLDPEHQERGNLRAGALGGRGLPLPRRHTLLHTSQGNLSLGPPLQVSSCSYSWPPTPSYSNSSPAPGSLLPLPGAPPAPRLPPPTATPTPRGRRSPWPCSSWRRRYLPWPGTRPSCGTLWPCWSEAWPS